LNTEFFSTTPVVLIKSEAHVTVFESITVFATVIVHGPV
jgi:hypothetical protein